MGCLSAVWHTGGLRLSVGICDISNLEMWKANQLIARFRFQDLNLKKAGSTGSGKIGRVEEM